MRADRWAMLMDGGSATGPRLLDELAARATSSSVDRTFDGWLAKAAPDVPFRRCNTVLPPAGAGDDPAAVHIAMEAIERWYAGLGQRVIVLISSADPGGSALDDLLAARDYVVEAPVSVMTREIAADVTTESRSDLGRGLEVVVTDGLDEAWAIRYGEVHGSDAEARRRTHAYGRMLGVLAHDALGAVALADGVPAGVGFGVLDAGWLGIFGMATSPALRRRGVAGAVVNGLIHRAAERGATAAYLQVETDNAPAMALYQAMGFTRSHRYHYRVSALR
ncbi:MAG: GNAT family N-acetyltransferase [Aquihabitans sp.]